MWRAPSTSDLDDMPFTSDVWSLHPSSLNIFSIGAKINVIKGTTEKPTRTVRDILVAFDSCNQTYSSSWAKMQEAPVMKHTNPRKLFVNLIQLRDERFGTHSAKLPSAIVHRSHRSGGCDVVVRRCFLLVEHWSPELRDKVFLQGGLVK